MFENISDIVESNLTDFNQFYNYNNIDNFNYNYDYGDKYLYAAFSFERPFYLYVLEIISITTFIGNLVALSILLRRRMRNPTNMVLVAIATSDSLTALVVLPTYVMVYTRYSSIEDKPIDNADDGYFIYSVSSQSDNHNDGCDLTKDLCNAFMISKYFLAKSFHTMSVFLTLFLSIQRYISIRFPYKSQHLLSLRKIVVCFGAIFVLSPFLHVYLLFGKRAYDGHCQWEMFEDGCGSDCVYMFLSFGFCQLTPCVILTLITILFIRQLRSGEKNLERMESSKSQISRRKDENKRILIIVTAIVVVFLIPEIPYSIFLLNNAIDKASNNGKGMNVKTNRIINLVYELLLVLSFHANIYVYIIFNRRFRKTAVNVYINPIRKFLGLTEVLSKTSSTSFGSSSKKTSETRSASLQNEMKPMIIKQP